MKKYLAERLRLSALVVAGALGTFALATPQWALAQNAPDKIRLMADTLRARDAGNLEQAKANAEELIKIAPDDENVQRLLASINREIERRSGGAMPSSAPVFGRAPQASAEQQMSAAANVSATGADAIMSAVAADQEMRIAAAENAVVEAEQLAELGAYAEAANLLNAAAASLSRNTATEATLDDIEAAQQDIILIEAEALVEAGDFTAAESALEAYAAAGGDSRGARRLARQIDRELRNPFNLDINDVSSDFVESQKSIRELLTRGRAQFLNGDYDGAQTTFKEVEARDANNAEAKLFQSRIAKLLGDIHEMNVYKTREQMLTEVDQQWERPKVFDISEQQAITEDTGGRVQEKLDTISIPQVNFSGMELTRVIETLSELSVEYDPERVGVNIVPLFDSNATNPRVNISLRNLSLDRILQFVTQQVNFAYDVGADAVTIQPSDSVGGSSTTVTEFFPVSRATIIRLTGFREGGGASAAPVDPFAAPSGGGGASGPSQSEEVEALRNFFQNAGVNFEIPGASLAFDGEQLIVTQSRRNLERMRTILRNYNEVNQVEIEAKFLEVSQNDLDEIGFDWTVSDAEREGSTVNRRLADGFTTNTSDSEIQISRPGENVTRGNRPPDLNTAIDLAAGAADLFTATGWSINGYDVDFALRALSRKTGSDLMSAPKVTVLSGKRASITVAQELRYPESYADIESTVSASETGGSAISITAGTPQDFVVRNIGVEMDVTPNVENDDTISLILEPRVTEFEGFVEYGGPSVAIAEDTVATIPAGFYQPVFSTREVQTEVTVFDGATVVMGGLTRDEVKSVKDSVPVLGDIPGLGRLFRSEGETRQKRNLLIFVTANLVSPGGSPARQNYRNLNANALFQNPTIMTPSGAINRSIEDNEE